MSRRLLGGLALLALLAQRGNAGDVADAAERVLSAHAAGDEAGLREIAAGPQLDPWVVADAVWRRSRPAARAFAAAVPGDRGVRLAAFLERRGATDDAIDALLQDLPTLGPEEALRRLASAEATDPLQRIRLELTRSQLLLQRREPAALDALRQVWRLSREVGWTQRMAQAAAGGTSFAQQLGEYEAAVELCQAWYEAAVILEDPTGQADALLNLGGLRVHLGDYQDAIETLQRAEALAAEAGASGLRIMALGSQAVLHKRRGAFQSAINTLELAVREAESDRIRGHLMSDLGLVYQLIGAYDEAERQHVAARAIFERLGDPLGTARAWGDLGACLNWQARYGEARDCLVRAEEFFRRPDSRRATVLENLGYALGHLDKTDEARDALNEAVDLTRKLRTPWHEGQVWASLGRIEQRAGRYPEALAAYDQCRTLADDLGSSVLREEAHLGRARALLARGEPAEALAAGRLAMAQVSRQVAGLSLARSAGARARHADVYTVTAKAALGAEAPEALFEVLESGRASAFLEAISDRDVLRDAVVPPELRAAEDAAREDVVRATEKFRAAYERGIRKEMRERRKELAEAERRLEEVEARLQREARSASDLLYPRPASLAQVQERLAKRDALVSYAMLDETVALVVTRQEARIVRLGASAELLDVCKAYEPDDGGRLEELRGLLVEPLGLGDDTRRVLVTLDGEIARLPVPVLMAGLDVTLIPSASTYVVLQDERTGTGKDVLAVGIARYGEARALTPLPGAEEEAQRVGDRLLLGDGATETALREALGRPQRWRAVHFACHGRFESEHPLRSGLALTEGGDGDGWLTAAEVFAARVPADLVVLAACEGGQGRFVPAEGLVGLTRAFLHAGAARVVSSAWAVDDAATSALMVEFYRQWRQGQTTSRALRLAREHVRSQPRWSSPRYWAGWQLWGLPD